MLIKPLKIALLSLIENIGYLLLHEIEVLAFLLFGHMIINHLQSKCKIFLKSGSRSNKNTLFCN